MRAIVGLSCVGAAFAAPRACSGDACPADELLDGISALQTAIPFDPAMLKHAALKHPPPQGYLTNNFTARPARSSAPRGAPFLGNKGGALDPHEEGKLLIEEDGVLNTYYLPGATIQDDGKTVMFVPPLRFYLMKEPTTDYSDETKFYKPIFPGKTFTVDMKLENVGCGCNVNFYLVDMPVPEAGKDNDHYCDGQCFNGLGCCAEFDMNEGNNAVQQITNHACTYDYPGHPDWACHKWGEPEVKVSPGEFAGGRGHTIDGNKPFTFSQQFKMTDGQLQVITTITQGAAKVVKTMGPNAQLQAMLNTGSLLNGMAFVTGYWTASDMNWLDGDICGSGPEHCSGAPAYISNWRLTTDTPAPPAPPHPAPGPGPGPAPVVDATHMCCWGGPEGCKGAEDWCGQASENCQGKCGGKWSQVSHKCCYGGQNCKADGDWCNGGQGPCSQCSGQWTRVLG